MTDVTAMFRALQARIDDLYYEIAEMKRRNANMLRPGIIKSFDGATGRAIADVGFETRPLRVMQFAGEMNCWNPMTAGQQIMVLSPSGDPGNGLIIAYGHSNTHPKPTDRTDQHQYDYGQTSQTIRKDAHFTASGDSGQFLKADGKIVLKVKDIGSIKLKDKNDQWFKIDPSVFLPTDPEDIS